MEEVNYSMTMGMESQTIRTWGSMMLTPLTALCYLTINRSENCAPADHRSWDSPSSPGLEKCLPETHWGVQAFWALAAQNSGLIFCNKRCTLLHYKLPSVDRLYCVPETGLKFGSVTFSVLKLWQFPTLVLPSPFFGWWLWIWLFFFFPFR